MSPLFAHRPVRPRGLDRAATACSPVPRSGWVTAADESPLIRKHESAFEGVPCYRRVVPIAWYRSQTRIELADEEITSAPALL